MSGEKKKNLITLLLVIIASFILGAILFGVYDAQVATKRVVARTEPEVDQMDSATEKPGNAAEISYEQKNIETESEALANVREVNIANLPDIDVSKLQETNPDIVGWVTIPGTKVDYPVAQHPTNDEYYLKHGANGMYSSSGCPYIELCDSGSFREFNTVIYGHNMNDGSMFASLHSFEDEVFFSKHRDLYIYTEDHSFTYRIFAAAMFDDRRIPYYFDDKLESDRTAFLQAIKSDIVADRSMISNDTEVSEDDCIVTLSTCDKKLRDKRFLVVAVLTKIDGQEVG